MVGDMDFVTLHTANVIKKLRLRKIGYFYGSGKGDYAVD